MVVVVVVVVVAVVFVAAVVVVGDVVMRIKDELMSAPYVHMTMNLMKKVRREGEGILACLHLLMWTTCLTNLFTVVIDAVVVVATLVAVVVVATLVAVVVVAVAVATVVVVVIVCC